MTDKRELRSAMRAERKRLAGLDAMAADRAASHISQLPPSDLIAVYWAIGSELRAEPIALSLEAEGLALCLPVVIALDAPMIFRRWSPGDPLEPDAAGVPAPFPLAETVLPDLVVTLSNPAGPIGHSFPHPCRTPIAMDAGMFGLAGLGAT